MDDGQDNIDTSKEQMDAEILEGLVRKFEKSALGKMESP
jgi:hypothetical protein